MMLVPTYVAPSAIEGVGVFAAEDISAGELIWRYDEIFDHLIPKSQLDYMEPVVREHMLRYAYPHAPDAAFLVYEIDNGRFMNHSVRPNTDFSDPDLGLAKCSINAGDEITGDYCEFWTDFLLLPAIANLRKTNGSSMPPAGHQLNLRPNL